MISLAFRRRRSSRAGFRRRRVGSSRRTRGRRMRRLNRATRLRIGTRF